MANKTTMASMSLYAWALLRISMGFIFLWAFLDKALGFGVSTCKGLGVNCSQAWLNGGSPTKGFLSNAATGPLAEFYHKLAGHMWVDILFMAGLMIVGVGLILGTWVRMAAFVGIVMLLFMWSALLWPSNTPGIDEHIIYALVLFGVALTDDHQVWGFRKQWLKTRIAKWNPILQ